MFQFIKYPLILLYDIEMHPLLENYEKYYGKKKEPKIPRIEDYEGEKTIADELKEIKEVSSLSKEQHEVLAPYLSSPYLSTTSGTSGIASISTRSNLITTSNSTVSITQKPKVTIGQKIHKVERSRSRSL